MTEVVCARYTDAELRAVDRATAEHGHENRAAFVRSAVLRELRRLGVPIVPPDNQLSLLEGDR